MQPHRIAIVTESFFPATGLPHDDTNNRTVKQVIDRLIDVGRDVLVVAPGPGLSTYRGARVARIGDAERADGRAPTPKWGPPVRRLLESWRPDLVHVVTPGRLGRKALKQATRLGIPTVTSTSRPVDHHESERFRRQVLARTDRLVVSSRWLGAELSEWGARAQVWRPGVDPAAFTPALRDERLHDIWARKPARAEPAVVVGHVGPLEADRDVWRLLEVAEIPGCRLVVVGDGPEKRALRRRLPDAVWLPTLDSGESAIVLASLDVIVQPSLRESSCHVIRQAAASGVPAIAPASGGVPDVVRHRATGLLYDPLFGLDLRHSLSTLIADAKRRLAMGASARAHVAQRRWSDAVDELIHEHYAAALDGARAAA